MVFWRVEAKSDFVGIQRKLDGQNANSCEQNDIKGQILRRLFKIGSKFGKIFWFTVE